MFGKLRDVHMFKQEKILISSDTLWEFDMAVMTIRVEGSMALLHMQESLQKLESLDVKEFTLVTGEHLAT